MVRPIKNKLLKLFFPEVVNTIEYLTKDNMELTDIALEQMKMIREVQDQVAKLDYEKEDLEVRIENYVKQLVDYEAEVAHLEMLLEFRENE